MSPDQKFIFISDYLRNNAENNKQWQDLQLLQDKNLGYSYGNNPLDDSGLGGMISNGMDESVQNVSRFLGQILSFSWNHGSMGRDVSPNDLSSSQIVNHVSFGTAEDGLVLETFRTRIRPWQPVLEISGTRTTKNTVLWTSCNILI